MVNDFQLLKITLNHPKSEVNFTKVYSSAWNCVLVFLSHVRCARTRGGTTTPWNAQGHSEIPKKASKSITRLRKTMQVHTHTEYRSGMLNLWANTV